MTKEIEFKTLQDTIAVQKANGTNVNYYIFDEYEIHLNQIKPHSIQEWHYHSQIEETLLVTKGELCCKYLENNMEQRRNVKQGELVLVKNSIHTFENNKDESVEFVVFRFVPSGESRRDVIKNDKTVVDIKKQI